MILKRRLNRLLCALVLGVSGVASANAQFAVKTNLLYDATTTPNLGVEVGVGNNDRQHQLKHWMLMPEFRWWTCSKFNGHFVGVHLLGGEYNASNINLPWPGYFFGGENIGKSVRDHRLEGSFIGGGFTYGYQWILGRHWNLEAEIGVGYAHLWYKKFNCNTCGRKSGDGQTNYVGVDKLGLSLMYIF